MQGQQDDPGEDLDGLTGLFGYTEHPDGRYTRRHQLGFKIALGQRQNVQIGRREPGWRHPDVLWSRYRPLFLHFRPLLEMLKSQKLWYTRAANDRFMARKWTVDRGVLWGPYNTQCIVGGS